MKTFCLPAYTAQDRIVNICGKLTFDERFNGF